MTRRSHTVPDETLVHRTTCRLCGSQEVELAIPYPATPIADAYLTSAQASASQPRYPLDLWFCHACAHVQLLDVVDPAILFRDYTYETSVSAGLVEHFRRYAEEVAAYAGAGDGARVVEIGSNDGSLLRFFRDRGLRVLGVDPATAIAEKATRAGVETLPEFFTREVALGIRRAFGPADVVAANNVFAHSDALPDMAEGIRDLLAPAGIFTFEVSYLPDIVERKLFDTVYHEHLCYHAVLPLRRFLAAHGLELVDFIRIPTKGGSFRGIAQRTGGPRPVSASVERQAAYERDAGYDGIEPLRALAADLRARKAALGELLRRERAAGRRLAGYGASATVTTLLHHFELHDLLEFVVDDNPKKHGTFAPGSALPVLPAPALLERRPDLVVVLAWSYAKPIIARQDRFRRDGGRFVVPLPTLEVS